MRATLLVLVGMIVAVAACGPISAAPNFVANPSFEDGFHGAFPTAEIDPFQQYAPTGWKNHNNDPWKHWQGVFDATWKNPSCDPAWPSALPPVDGSYALGHWFPPQSGCEYDNVNMGGRRG